MDEFRQLLRALKASKESIVNARKWLTRHPPLVEEALGAVVERARDASLPDARLSALYVLNDALQHMHQKELRQHEGARKEQGGGASAATAATAAAAGLSWADERAAAVWRDTARQLVAACAVERGADGADDAASVKTAHKAAGLLDTWARKRIFEPAQVLLWRWALGLTQEGEVAVEGAAGGDSGAKHRKRDREASSGGQSPAAQPSPAAAKRGRQAGGGSTSSARTSSAAGTSAAARMAAPAKMRRRDERPPGLSDLPRDVLEHAVKFVALCEVPAVAVLSKALAQAAAGDVLWESLAAIAFPQLASMRAGMRAPRSWRALVKQQCFARGKAKKKGRRNTAASNYLLTVRLGRQPAFSVPLHKAGFAVWRDDDVAGCRTERKSFYRPAIVFPVSAELHAAVMAGAPGGSETIALEVMVCQQDTGGIGICKATRAGNIHDNDLLAEGELADALRDVPYKKKGRRFKSGGGGAFWNLDEDHSYDAMGGEPERHFASGDDHHEGPISFQEGSTAFLNAELMSPSEAGQIMAAITPDVSEPLVSKHGSLGALAGSPGGAVLALLCDTLFVEDYSSIYWERSTTHYMPQFRRNDGTNNYDQARESLFDQIHTWVLSMPMTSADGRQEDFCWRDREPQQQIEARKQALAQLEAVDGNYESAPRDGFAYKNRGAKGEGYYRMPPVSPGQALMTSFDAACKGSIEWQLKPKPAPEDGSSSSSSSSGGGGGGGGGGSESSGSESSGSES